ncbi:hypothetical protein [Polaribacter sp.]|uniref:hypothetical protein n=1 Tax=Polaribacter sp. TaxID=1920175 RepID=UPI003F6AAB97
MKVAFVSFFMLISMITFSQKNISKTFETFANEVNIYTAGLDNLVIENSDTNFIEVFLYAESYDEQLIKIENNDKLVNIKFDFEGTETREVIFRKFITKRLQRAHAVVKVPKNKKVYIFGENVDIASKSIENNLAIYIENGIVKLNEINANTILKLYSGNVYASIKNTNLHLTTKSGNIKIDGILQEKGFQRTSKNASHQFKVTTIKGNIFLSKD